jgi:Outer membrane protein beta-barrel domain
MKKIILFAAFAVSCITSMAQVSFGVQLGVNYASPKTDNYTIPGIISAYPFSYSTPSYLIPRTAPTSNPKLGYLIGFVAEIPINKKIAFKPELIYIQKGHEGTKSDNFKNDIATKFTLNYLELPLNVVYKLNVGKGSLFFGLGTALSFGIYGKEKGKIIIRSPADISNLKKDYIELVKFDGKSRDDLNQSILFKDNRLHLTRFDIGANLLAGYQSEKGIFFKLGYNYGLLNIDPNKNNKLAENQSSYRNRGFNVCIGYMIGGSKNDD